MGLLKPVARAVSGTRMSTFVGQEREVLCQPGGHGYVIEVFEACRTTDGFFPTNPFDASSLAMTGASKTPSTGALKMKTVQRLEERLRNLMRPRQSEAVSS